MKEEVETIIKFAKNYLNATETYPLHHIDSPQRVKGMSKRQRRLQDTSPSSKILDWGSGYGAMFFLLHNRGAPVTLLCAGVMERCFFSCIIEG